MQFVGFIDVLEVRIVGHVFRKINEVIFRKRAISSAIEAHFFQLNLALLLFHFRRHI